LSIDPNNVQALKLKGDSLLELERYNETIKTLYAALKVDPNNKKVLEILQKTMNLATKQ
jgi:tetratricopeptide (TPR) repeat protein